MIRFSAENTAADRYSAMIGWKAAAPEIIEFFSFGSPVIFLLYPRRNRKPAPLCIILPGSGAKAARPPMHCTRCFRWRICTVKDIIESFEIGGFSNCLEYLSLFPDRTRGIANFACLLARLLFFFLAFLYNI